jgi:RNA polymerase sigma-70 factor (ECF subfamily)
MENLTELDDLALVRQIQHGNETAMTEFFHRFAPGLYGYISRRIREPSDIEDILAETMAASVTAIMRFQGQSRVFTWLCRIANFKVADHYRRSPGMVLSLEESAQVYDSNPGDLETPMMVQQVLMSLNQEYRRVLTEKYMMGFSTREIAWRMGRTEKAVESVLVRARQAFAREYARLAPEKEG